MVTDGVFFCVMIAQRLSFAPLLYFCFAFAYCVFARAPPTPFADRAVVGRSEVYGMYIFLLVMRALVVVSASVFLP